MSDQMSAAEAAGIAKRGRKLLRRGSVTHRQLALLDCLLWSCRSPGRARARASYTRLCELAHVSRETVAEALRVLERLNLVVKEKVRLRVAWGGGTASRQGVSHYRLLPTPRTEFAGTTVNLGQEILVLGAKPDQAQEQAARALAEVRRVRTDVLTQQWLRTRGMA